MKQNNKLKAGVLSSLLLISSSSVFAEAPKVLASIKPLQLISQAITEGITHTEVLLPPGASPHNHSMRPSDARKLHSADLIFWVGPAMETFLERSLPSPENAASVAMMDIEGITLLANDESDHDEHEYDDHHSHERERHEHGRHGHDHHHGKYDPHIWLSPKNGKAIAKAMANALADIDAKHAGQYQQNLTAFLKDLDKTDKRNKAIVKQLNDQPMFVFHDAYGYLQDQYQLNIAGHFTLNPEQQPGAKHLTELRDQLKSSGNTCVFREPQFQPAYINRITEGLPVKVGILDPLGGEIKVKADGYSLFISSLVDNISECLTLSAKVDSKKHP